MKVRRTNDPAACEQPVTTYDNDNRHRLIAAVSSFQNTGFSLATALMESDRPVGVTNQTTECVEGDAAIEPRSDGKLAIGDDSVARDVLAIE